MSLRDVMAYVQKQQAAGAAATPATPEKTMGLQAKPAWIGACTPATPATPHLNEVGTSAQIGQLDAAANDHDTSSATAAPVPDVEDWRVLASAYHQHHFKCPICIAAGRGVRYGLRCGVGAALWTAYDDAARCAPMPWHKPPR